MRFATVGPRKGLARFRVRGDMPDHTAIFRGQPVALFRLSLLVLRAGVP